MIPIFVFLIASANATTYSPSSDATTTTTDGVTYISACADDGIITLSCDSPCEIGLLILAPLDSTCTIKAGADCKAVLEPDTSTIYPLATVESGGGIVA